MKYQILIVLFSVTVSAKADVNSFIAGADKFFSTYVRNGMVSYKTVKTNLAEIESLYGMVGSMNLTGVDDVHRKAFYINAYNLIVIYQVSKYYPLKSPLSHSGFFDKVEHKVAGEMITLNELEIKKLLQAYGDARIHFALACAAKSCPPLASFAYQPDKLDEQLNARATQAINNKTWLKVDASRKKVELSKIFEWYQKDFTAAGGSVIDWINKFRKEKIPSAYSVSYYEYDWALNEM